MAARISNAKPQRQEAQTLDGKASSKKRSRPRFTLRIERHSVRLLDRDNFIGGCKAFIDVVRNIGLIPDDDPKSCHIEFHQVQVARRADQGVRIIVTEHEETDTPPSDDD